MLPTADLGVSVDPGKMVREVEGVVGEWNGAKGRNRAVMAGGWADEVWEGMGLASSVTTKS